jgi:hypothetical protein
LLPTIAASSSLFIHFFFWWDWGLKSGIHTYKAGILLLEPHLQSILLWFILEVEFHELLAQADLKLPSS